MDGHPAAATARSVLDHHDLYQQDFLLTWQHSNETLQAILLAARMLRQLRLANQSPRVFDSGLGVSIFRDHSTRTRFSFASACNLLGLAVQELDEGKSQIAHGETVRETAQMIAFMADVIGIRDDLYIGRGHAYMQAISAAVADGFATGLLEQRPMVINLQSDLDHPTQTLTDLQHIVDHFGDLDRLRGKKIVMSWAYSPSYGKPLSVPQGIIALMTRFGLDVTLAHPPGYELMPEITALAGRQAAASGGQFRQTDSLADAFSDADIVYAKSWAPFAAMSRRADLAKAGDEAGLQRLEIELLAQNARHRDWETSEALMQTTRQGSALYLHCLPADISGVSCAHGEVAASVFARYRPALYRQASWKPYIIAAMILLGRLADPAGTLEAIAAAGQPRLMSGSSQSG